jgi:mannosyl-oligosaccharide alpha-1,2-mannosidase
VVVVCGLVYFWYRPIDILAVPFEMHETYMNDRANIKGFVAKQSYDWRQAAFQNTIESYTPLPKGDPRSLPSIQFKFPEESSAQKALREKRRVAVRNEFKRSWESYTKFAWTMDELLPIKGQGLETFGGWGATLVDSLDTLWIMGFKKEFYDAVEAVSRIDFGASEENAISVFETTIRYLGGLLSAYDLSHEKVLLDKAEQIGEMLYRAFDTPNNMPLDRLTIKAAKKPEGGGYPADSNICFAGIGSLTMEFTRLAQVTGRSKYYDAVARVTDFLDSAQNTTKIPGLFPEWVNAANQDMSTDRTFTLGAMADSSYEYFPKMFALLGGLEPVYKKLYEDTAPMIDKHMLFRPMLPDPKEGEELLFSGDVHANTFHESLDPEMQHLTCFIGGFFALAGRLFKNDYHVDLGAKLTEGELVQIWLRHFNANNSARLHLRLQIHAHRHHARSLPHNTLPHAPILPLESNPLGRTSPQIHLQRTPHRLQCHGLRHAPTHRLDLAARQTLPPPPRSHRVRLHHVPHHRPRRVPGSRLGHVYFHPAGVAHEIRKWPGGGCYGDEDEGWCGSTE